MEKAKACLCMKNYATDYTLDSFALSLQVRWWIFFIKGIPEKVYVLKQRSIGRDIVTSMHGLYSPLSFNITQQYIYFL
jgi:hypothetical protein